MMATWKNRSVTRDLPAESWRPTEGYWFDILFVKEEDGTYSAIVLNLPGIGSCGDTADEAVENVKEAIRGALEAYTSSGDEIPWKQDYSVPVGATHKRIIVNA